MNRPSRTDDDLEHPTWNQNPPFLAPDLTTREDLNGIANSRVMKNTPGGSAAALSLLSEGSPFFGQNDPECDESEFDGMELSELDCASLTRGPVIFLRVEIVPLKERLHQLLSRLSHSKAWGWTWWIASVLATSLLLSSLGLTPSRGASDAQAPPPLAPRVIYRRDQCEENSIRSSDYDVPLHVGALLIVMFVSTLTCVFPVLARRFPRMRIPDAFFFAIRHFGTGVLIATAFIHLLPTAFESLSDPCLSQFWTDDYPAMPGAIALAGVFFVIVIEMVLSPARQFSRKTVGGRMAAEAGNRPRGSVDDTQIDSPAPSIEMASRRVDEVSTAARLTPANADAAGVGSKDGGQQRGSFDPETLTSGHVLTEEQKLQKNILQCVLLEIGILFHSVFIGMALSVAVGREFVILLIAIIFHRRWPPRFVSDAEGGFCD